MGRHVDGRRRSVPVLLRRTGRRGGAGALALVAMLGFTSFAAVSASGATRAAAATCATLSVGAHGAAVATIQQAVGAVPDGDFGPATRAAVRHWQARHHLRPTGRIDAATWSALPSAVSTLGCAQPVRGSRGIAASCAVLRTGSVGPAVRVLQTAVRATPDGAFGPLTLAAVQAAQRRLDLPVTRAMGPATWTALGLTGTPACITAGPTPRTSGDGTSTAGTSTAGTSTSGTSTSGAETGGSPTPAASPAPAQKSPAPTASPSATASRTPRVTPTPTPTPTPALPSDWPAQLVVRAQVVKLAAALPSTPGASASPVVAQMLTFARAQTGKPYAWGGVGPRSYDCSGLVMTSYRNAGITLPRVAADQYAAGTAVPLDQVQQGDLVFYASDVTKPATIYHVAIYAGAGKVLDAPYTGAYVGVRPLWTRDLLPIAVRPVGLLSLPVGPGATGWTVTQLQTALNRLGARLAVDGADGPATTTAVKQWQSSHHLSATGVVDTATWLTLH